MAKEPIPRVTGASILAGISTICSTVSRFHPKRLKFLGQGEEVQAYGTRFEVEFEEGRPKLGGNGKKTFASGLIHEGTCNDYGKFHGQGFQTLNGVRRPVLFEEGDFINYLD